MKNYKEVIPNILTATRLVLTPVIIVLGFLSQYAMVIILSVICSLTDLFDGKLARKWCAVSDKGAKLDAIADKVFIIGITLCLVKSCHILIFPLVLEIAIAVTNLYYYKQQHRHNVLMIGKFKTTAQFCMIIASMICIFYSKLLFLQNGFILATVNLQVLCLIFYYQSYIDYEDETKLEKTRRIKKNKNKPIYDYELGKTKKIDNLKDLVKKES